MLSPSGEPRNRAGLSAAQLRTSCAVPSSFIWNYTLPEGSSYPACASRALSRSWSPATLEIKPLLTISGKCTFGANPAYSLRPRELAGDLMCRPSQISAESHTCVPVTQTLFFSYHGLSCHCVCFLHRTLSVSRPRAGSGLPRLLLSVSGMSLRTGRSLPVPDE